MLLTQYQASQLIGAPDRTKLYKLVNSPNPPPFAIVVEDKIKINTEDPSWLALLNSNTINDKKKGAKVNPLIDISPEMQILEMQALQAKCEAPILKNKALRLKLKELELNFHIQQGDLITFKDAEMLFFGYMESINVELLSLIKKLKPIIENFCKEKDYSGLISFLSNEHSTILNTVKTEQRKEVKSWRLRLETKK